MLGAITYFYSGIMLIDVTRTIQLEL